MHVDPDKSKFNVLQLSCINFGRAPRYVYISEKFPAEGRPADTDQVSDDWLVTPGIQQGFDFMTVVKTELFVFLHDNTNISRLAENPEGCAPQGFFSRCTYLFNSEYKEVVLKLISTVGPMFSLSSISWGRLDVQTFIKQKRALR